MINEKHKYTLVTESIYVVEANSVEEAIKLSEDWNPTYKDAEFLTKLINEHNEVVKSWE